MNIGRVIYFVEFVKRIVQEWHGTGDARMYLFGTCDRTRTSVLFRCFKKYSNCFCRAYLHSGMCLWGCGFVCLCFQDFA